MAQWGSRDPRWIVQERQDGSNVNGWHWTEKNKLEWSRQRLAELLVGLQAAACPGVQSASITAVKSVTGEAYLTMRKGNKKAAIFDLTLTLSWEGRAADSDSLVKGEVSVSEFASTSEPEDILISVSADKDAKEPAAGAVRGAVHGLRPDILAALERFAAALAAES